MVNSHEKNSKKLFSELVKASTDFIDFSYILFYIFASSQLIILFQNEKIKNEVNTSKKSVI